MKSMEAQMNPDHITKKQLLRMYKEAVEDDLDGMLPRHYGGTCNTLPYECRLCKFEGALGYKWNS